MRKAIFLFLMLIPSICLADLQSSFIGSRFPCDLHESTIFCSNGQVNGSNNLLDTSGSNLLTYSEDFSDASWTKTNVTVTADQVRGPGSTTLNADLLTPTAADSYVYQDATATVGTQYTCSFYLRSVAGNVNLSIHAYDQAHGTILEAEAIIVTPFWRRFSVAAIPVAGDTDVGCTIGGNTTMSTGENIYAVRAQASENDRWRAGAGTYHEVATTVTKPLHDLSDTNDPITAKADLQMAENNRGEAREYDGATNFYSVAHDASFNIFDDDHTITLVVRQDDAGGSGEQIFSHGLDSTDGIYIDATTAWDVTYSQAADSVTASGPAGSISDGYFHIVQIVRELDSAIVYVNGVAGVGVDITGYGIDGAKTLYVGVDNTGAANYFDGRLSYFRIDSEALSVERLAAEREILLGIGTNFSNNIP